MALQYPLTSLHDDAIRLREWRLDDVACIEAASADARIPEGTTVPATWSPDEGRAYIERQWSRQTSGEGLSFAIARIDDDRAIGSIVLMMRWLPETAGIGYWLLDSERGRGVAKRAVGLLAPWAVTEGGIARVEGLVEPENIASQRVLESCGFQLEGRLRSYLVFPTRRADALSYSLIAPNSR